MNLSDIGIVFTMCSTLAGAGTIGGSYYMENELAEYVPISQLQDIFDDRDIKDLRKAISSLEWDRDNGGLTQKEQWELKQLQDELKALLENG